MALPLRSRLTAATVLGVALTLGGCSFASPIETADLYAPSDGTRLEISERLTVENLMVVTEAEGEEGRVLGAVVNNTGERAEVTIDLDGEEIPVTVEGNSTVNFTDDEVTVASTSTPPGGTVPATISTPQSGGMPLAVPVLDGTLAPYDEWVPGS